MKLVRIIFLALIGFLFFQIGSEYWIFKQIQRRLDVKLTGRFIPVPFLPFFYLQHISFEWDNRVRLISADLKCEFNYDFLTTNHIRVKLSSQGPKMELLGGWSKLQGIQNVTLDRFFADLTFDQKGLSEIHSVHADSSSFQFHLDPSQNVKRTLAVPAAENPL